ITITAASVSVTNNQFTKFSVTGDLALPPDLKSKNGDRIEIKGINLAYDVAGNKLSVTVPPQSQSLDVYWNKFALHCNGFKLDLTGPDKGITINQADLDLPVDVFSTGGGKTASIKVTNSTVNGHGVSGGVEVTTNSLQGIKLLG